jgi:glycosyltransferase involved in cell wall biosynthesis
VLPSVHEPLGISHVEAGAAGIPSIGSAAGGAREIVGDGGTVVDPSSPDDLLRAMRHLADPQRAQAAGRRALERSRLYTWPLVARRMLAALGVPAAGGAP